MNILNTSEAGQLLGVTARRVVQLIVAGRLKATRLGREYMIDPADLAAVAHRPWGRPLGYKPPRT